MNPETPKPTPAPRPSRSLCTKALQGTFGPTARFQNMHGDDGDGAIGWRVLVDGQEIVRITPKDECLGLYNPFDPAMPFALLLAAGHAAGIAFEVDGNGSIHARQIPQPVAQAPQVAPLEPVMLAEAPAQVPPGACCERDHDGDGNCDRHPATIDRSCNAKPYGPHDKCTNPDCVRR